MKSHITRVGLATAGQHVVSQDSEQKPGQRSGRILIATMVALGLLLWTSLELSSVKLVYNPTDSVAPGWYLIQPLAELAPGHIVLVRLPAEAATLAAQRGYLPMHIPLLKPIAALAPQRVCRSGDWVLVDDSPMARVLTHDRLGRVLRGWQDCRRLVDDELFLLSTENPESFDSRYFGPVHATAVLGTAHPMMLKP
ncbi:S26 family signal peptidase [Pseudomonas jinjuensis]|uniref:Conjugative transfer signal peptidase TraF n=1 Tax=Pseudomonas jinjuensis TaxID=198616 RepID=A0A1H0JKX3_9PSED|nr:conjugative transfer signal peptidase TraF [Pseudomonas jinjuensis]